MEYLNFRIGSLDWVFRFCDIQSNGPFLNLMIHLRLEVKFYSLHSLHFLERTPDFEKNRCYALSYVCIELLCIHFPFFVELSADICTRIVVVIDCRKMTVTVYIHFMVYESVRQFSIKIMHFNHFRGLMNLTLSVQTLTLTVF